MLLPVNKSYYCSRSVLILPLLSLPLIFCTFCEKEPKVSGPPKKITIACSTAANAILVCIAFAEVTLLRRGWMPRRRPIP